MPQPTSTEATASTKITAFNRTNENVSTGNKKSPLLVIEPSDVSSNGDFQTKIPANQFKLAMKTPPANKVLTINNQKFQLPNIDQQKYGIITINVNINTEGKAIVTIKALSAEGKKVFDMKSTPNSSGPMEFNSGHSSDWASDQKPKKSEKYKSIQDYREHITQDSKGYSKIFPRTPETQPVSIAVGGDENADEVPVSKPGVALDVSKL